MDLDDKFHGKVSGVQSLSSSVQSTPEKNGNSDDASRSPELIQEYLKSSGPKKELLRTCFDKDKKLSASFKGKMTELKSLGSKTIKKESKKTPTATNNQISSKKQKRKGENPVRIIPVSDQSADFGSSSSWICKNAACRAVLSIDDSFCKRCSCCICHSFDENKDPSLWLFCSTETANGDSCGLSCHIECAFQHEKVGVVDHGQLMQLDGSYCCASCGKVSGILESWKKQLVIAKDARRVDLFCYRIYLCYRLLDGTSRFKELHELIKEAKAKLETEVGPLNGVSAKMARGIVSRLPVAADVHKLCTLAIERAEEWLASASNVNSNCIAEGSLPAACRFFFEEVSSSSVIIILIEMSTASSDDIKGYKLWYTKSRDETPAKEPISVFPKTQRRILISNLQPCTEYTFRIVSYTESGDLGHSEAKCFTKSVEIFRRHPSSSSPAATGGAKDDNTTNNEGGSTSKATTEGSSDLSGFRVRELGKIIRMAWAKERACSEGYCCDAADSAKAESTRDHELPAVSRQLDLNVMSVPDLNEELTPPFESSRDEDNGCTLEEHAVEADDDAASHDNIKKDSLDRSNGSGDSAPAVDSRGDRKRPAPSQQQRANDEVHDCDSTLINGSPFRPSRGSGSLDDNFESCVKIIRWLECGGHIDQEFRLKLLTWFSLRSTEQERRVVHTFIRTMIDDPSSLAEQLIDSFSDIVSSKRPRNGFCSKLWH